MAICTFYPRGTCKFGDSCKNDHPGSARDSSRGGWGSNQNRFGAFNRGGDSYRPGQQSGGGAYGGNKRTPIDKEDIRADFTSQRPVYPLSCYGPGKNAPRQLIEGTVEISPEELRLRYYTQRASVGEAAAQQEETQLAMQMQSQIDKILTDLNGAARYIEEGYDIHPNLLDIVEGKAPISTPTHPFRNPSSTNAPGGSQPQPSAFGQPSASGANSAFGQQQRPTTAFGQSSVPGQAPSTFGQPAAPSAFGQPAKMGASGAFGQPSMPSAGASAFGRPSGMGATTGFGQPSAMGASSSGFGQPSMPGAGSAFGQPAVLGQKSAFGQPSAPGAASAFGQPSAPGTASALGQPSAPGAASGFGQPSMPGQASAFGATNALGQSAAAGKPGFGTSGFGQLTMPGAGASPFAQQKPGFGTSGFGQPAALGAGASPFSQQKPAASQASPFGQQPQPAQASAFGKPSQPTSAFGQPSAPGTSAFGQPSAPKPAAANPFASTLSQAQLPQTTATAGNPFASTLSQAQLPQSTPAPSAFGQPASLGSSLPPPAQAAPAAAPSSTADAKERFKEGKPEEYEGDAGRALEEVYLRVAQMGFFNEDDSVPETPPKLEWIVPVAIN